MLIQENDIVLFQGDSITDSGRNRDNGDDLGNGYALMAAAEFSYKYPRHQVKFFNRGISGNRVPDLQRRWQDDCLALKPNVVSIYIGINDTWRRYDSGNPTSAEDFYTNYRQLIIQTKDALNPKLVLVEPFVLPVREQQKEWREDLDPKIAAVRELAREFADAYVPLDGLFAEASVSREPAYWAPDGVHLSPAGSALVADAWLKAVGAK
ncbi:SGNH/GDSL hydrolase family protein [Marinicrinis lubricantis]|uniref:SGNH/GDSL hydrolase family protein n=1 Tax=Marinicrinis lubricantis TaxID=2086470 RepID=A0ABW1IVQ0_9BACL